LALVPSDIECVGTNPQSKGSAPINVTFSGRGEWYVRSHSKGQATIVSPAVPEMSIAVLQQKRTDADRALQRQVGGRVPWRRWRTAER
jgi:hypothetical protein